MSYRILLIDHDDAGAERIERSLTEAGYDVTVAADAAEAMDLFERLQPDLTVIEALFPEKRGALICKEIKESAGKGTPVVLLLEEDEDKQAKARADDLNECDLLIERSIDDEELLELCGQLLRTRAAQAEPEEEASPTEEEPPVAQTTGADDSMLDASELAGALSNLDTIIDRQAPPDSAESETTEEGSDESPQEEEKVRKAEESGDFSYIAAEMEQAQQRHGEEEPPAEAVANTPLSPSADGENEPENDPAAGMENGQDIEDHLDSLFSPSGPGEPTPAEKQVLSWTFNNGSDPKSPQPPSEEPAAPAPEEPADVEERSAAGAEEPAPESGDTWNSDWFAPETPKEEAAEAAEADDDAEIDLDGVIGWDEPEDQAAVSESADSPVKETAAAATPAAAVQTATFASSEATETFESPATSSGPKKWWLIAACVVVLAVGGGAIFMLSGRSPSDPSLAGTGSNGGPPVAEKTPYVASAIGADSSDESTQNDLYAPTDENSAAGATAATTATTTAESRPAPKPVPAATTPKPKAAPKPEPVPEPEPVRVAAAPTPKPKAAPKPKPVPEPEPVRIAAAPTPNPEPKAAPKPKPVPEPEPVKVATAAAAEPVPVPPAAPPVPAATPLELIQRVEPSYAPKSLKKARGGRIVLKLLINEQGRVSRVIVDKGSAYKDLEAAAVGAVLRWTYRPATEAGEPVKAWTKAEFDL